MIKDQVHTAVSSAQACLGVTLWPGGETMARYLKEKGKQTLCYEKRVSCEIRGGCVQNENRLKELRHDILSHFLNGLNYG